MVTLIRAQAALTPAKLRHTNLQALLALRPVQRSNTSLPRRTNTHHLMALSLMHLLSTIVARSTATTPLLQVNPLTARATANLTAGILTALSLRQAGNPVVITKGNSKTTEHHHQVDIPLRVNTLLLQVVTLTILIQVVNTGSNNMAGNLHMVSSPLKAMEGHTEWDWLLVEKR